jgi:carbamoyltransferase
MTNIAFYGSHNAAYAIERDGELLVNLELERFLDYKNSGIAQYKTAKVYDIQFLSHYIPKFLMKKFGIEKFDNCYYLNTQVIIDKSYELAHNIPADNYIHCLHHESHAACAFYQSSYDKALIFSYDGGGNDGMFNIFSVVRGYPLKLLHRCIHPSLTESNVSLGGTGYDLGFPYMLFGHYLDDITFEPLSEGNLVYPGKVMGLAPYGKVNEEWLPLFVDFYNSQPDGNDFQEKIDALGVKIDIKFDTNNRLKGDIAYDVAATSQAALEECFFFVTDPFVEQYKDWPICITGGCGLNIILNTRAAQRYNRPVFVGPSPNDCGIALGMLLNHMAPDQPVDCTYAGLELTDIDTLGSHIQHGHTFLSHVADIPTIAKAIIDGNIVGVARGRSETGPRALGNRSILCNPAIADMKDILNKKVKHREWYRPFAPVCRLEDVNEYFEWDRESRWMTFCPLVREEWRDKLPSITHVDNSARVQTVTSEQNKWLYDLLTEIKQQSGVGVLLNTSFNVNGKPILSTIREAFQLFKDSEMDCLVVEDSYFVK